MAPTAHHIGITVDDLEAMTAFYRDTLGFDVEAEVSSADDEIDAEALTTLVGISDTDLSAGFLEAPGCAVELLKYHEPLGESAVGVANNDIGAHQFAFEVDNIDTWHNRVVDAGAVVTSEPVDFGITPRFYCNDPEENVVELLEAE
ncbi:VOC family protein [Haloquadratum walsbyi]|jgi:Lactoylglutathione lyase and related lyases|uniref:Lactoylglutathione lyase n=1 Tax=Haloquadratum walsbyi J07HQW2 TaxID=1238425 RepID=U1PNN6_9EURY|nr:VOC family protein [Haloquadratum walsbyi]ERG93851.1 MAG: lactoylglutathione lyase [Haloquadratum walsbyi J07HQW2]